MYISIFAFAALFHQSWVFTVCLHGAFPSFSKSRDLRVISLSRDLLSQWRVAVA